VVAGAGRGPVGHGGGERTPEVIFVHWKGRQRERECEARKGRQFSKKVDIMFEQQNNILSIEAAAAADADAAAAATAAATASRGRQQHA
jgi:hypothetical protein